MKNFYRRAFIAVSSVLAGVAMAWSGYYVESGNIIDVEFHDEHNLLEGPVNYYDHQSGALRSGYLAVYEGGSGVIIDDATGESQNIEAN